jgi:hypothetical protein
VVRAEAEGRPVPPQPARRTPESYIYDPLVPAPARPREDAERLMRAFLPLAFRRPAGEELTQYYVKLVHKALDRKVPFTEAMILGYKAVLCSPHFLFLPEPIQQGPAEQRTKLDDHALAARLSYFLWSSMPDDELLKVAARGELRQPDVLRGQVERLLKDSRARRFTANFAGQWLELRNINATSPDPQLYGEFDDFLFWSMPRETERFFEEILRADRSLTEFVHSDWSFLNQRLAQHYGIPGVHGGELRMVKLPEGSHRGGVLTQASIMKVTADGTRTSPVLRGKWVLDNILGAPVPPPPPDIPQLKEKADGEKPKTMREQIIKGAPTDSDRLHGEFIASIRDLMKHVGDQSKLILDPDLDTYYLMDAVVLKLPERESLLSEHRRVAQRALAAQQVDEPDKAEFLRFAGLLETNLNEVVRGQRIACASCSCTSFRTCAGATRSRNWSRSWRRRFIGTTRWRGMQWDR